MITAYGKTTKFNGRKWHNQNDEGRTVYLGSKLTLIIASYGNRVVKDNGNLNPRHVIKRCNLMQSDTNMILRGRL